MWYSQDDVIDTYSMLKRFDQAGQYPHDGSISFHDVAFGCVFSDGPNNGVPSSCAGMLTERNGRGPNYLVDDMVVEEVRMDEDAFFNLMMERMEIPENATGLQKSYANKQVLDIIERASELNQALFLW